MDNKEHKINDHQIELFAKKFKVLYRPKRETAKRDSERLKFPSFNLKYMVRRKGNA